MENQIPDQAEKSTALEMANLPGCLFCFSSLFVILILFILSISFLSFSLWFDVLCIYIFAIPLVAASMYASTIRQIRLMHIFTSRGFIFRFCSGRLIRYIFWTAWSLVSSVFILLVLYKYTFSEWMLLLISIPIFKLYYVAALKYLSKEIKTFIAVSFALSSARLFCALTMGIISLLVFVIFGSSQSFETLSDAVEHQRSFYHNFNGSDLIFEISNYASFIEGLKYYTISQISTSFDIINLTVSFLGSVFIYYNVFLCFTFLIVPIRELKRIFLPFDTDINLPTRGASLAFPVAVFVFFSIFIYVPLFYYFEIALSNNPQIAESRKKIERIVTTSVEQIGDKLYKEGTLEAIESYKREFFQRIELENKKFELEIDRAYDKMLLNVDSYLDWYYSLAGEYSRIAKLLLNELESYLAEKFEEHMQLNNPFEGLTHALQEFYSNNEQIEIEFDNKVKKLLSKSAIQEPIKKYKITTKVKSIQNLTDYEDHLTFNARLLGSGTGTLAGGVLSAIIAKKIANKIMLKGTIKMAAKALGKVIAGKAGAGAAGAAGGAAVGAAVGSIIPGAGTAVGAAIGGIVGAITVGVTVDKLLLMLEEAISREDFKKEIVQSINESKNEFKSSIKAK